MHMMSISVIPMKILSALVALPLAFAAYPSCTDMKFNQSSNLCETKCGESCPELSTYVFKDESNAFVYLAESNKIYCLESNTKRSICRPVQFLCESPVLDQTFGPTCVTSCGSECPTRAVGTNKVDILFRTAYLGRSKPLKDIAASCPNRLERNPCFFDKVTVAELGSENPEDIKRKEEEAANAEKAKMIEIQRHEQQKKEEAAKKSSGFFI